MNDENNDALTPQSDHGKVLTSSQSLLPDSNVHRTESAYNLQQLRNQEEQAVLMAV